MSALTQLVDARPSRSRNCRPPGTLRTRDGGLWRDDVFVEPVSEDDVRGSIVVRTVTGVPAFALQVTTPRTVHVMGQQSLSLLGFVLAAFGAVACVVVGRAITRQQREAVQREQAEESLRSSEERHRSLIAQMTDAVLGIAPDGRIVFANPEAARMTGLDVEDAVLQPSRQYRHPRIDEQGRSATARRRLLGVVRDRPRARLGQHDPGRGQLVSDDLR